MNKRIKQLIKEGKTTFQIVNIILREFKKKRSQPIIDIITDIKGNRPIKDLPICYVCSKKILTPKQIQPVGKGLYRHKTGKCYDATVEKARKNVYKKRTQ